MAENLFSPEVDLGSSLPEAPPDFRSGFIALIGRPNVGKSTLMNALLGQKIAITSPIAQTTRNRLLGILTLPTAQILLLDTPGIHKPHHRLGEILVKTAQTTASDVDAILLVVDGSVPAGRGDQYICQSIGQSHVPIVICLNKSDLVAPAHQNVLRESYQTLLPKADLICLSALDPATLPPLLTHITQILPLGPYYYPPDLVTDQPERFLMGELIREQILLHTRDEIPHSVAVTIDLVEESASLTRILATIYVERSSQKGILIGKGGEMLKRIGQAARLQMQKLISGKIYLELFVKVKPHWRRSNSILRDLGYKEDV
jgi:GTP-binding protein Era